jgi:hypothetical protein
VLLTKSTGLLNILQAPSGFGRKALDLEADDSRGLLGGDRTVLGIVASRLFLFYWRRGSREDAEKAYLERALL